VNAWTDGGHAVNQIYDMLYMMDRDDIPVGMGGDGGILHDGTIHPNVGGFLPLIEQVEKKLIFFNIRLFGLILSLCVVFDSWLYVCLRVECILL